VRALPRTRRYARAAFMTNRSPRTRRAQPLMLFDKRCDYFAHMPLLPDDRLIAYFHYTLDYCLLPS